MNSPFPGMDPYLEDPAFWPDFHSRFINYWCEHLADTLPESYEARIAERVYVVEPEPGVKKTFGPDVTVSRTPKRKPAHRETGATTTLEPVIIDCLVLDEMREGYITVIHRRSREVVTVLELLSPANKTGEGRQVYLRKREALMLQHIHTVELDLLLQGQAIALAKPLPKGDYHCFVTRSDQRIKCEVYTWNMPDALPITPVPLHAPDADVFCDLAQVFAITYERGRYRRDIDYRKAPPIKLSASRKKWLTQQLRSAKK